MKCCIVPIVIYQTRNRKGTKKVQQCYTVSSHEVERLIGGSVNFELPLPDGQLVKPGSRVSKVPES